MNVKTLNVKVDEFVSYTMSFLNNIQVFHWQTQSYAEHEALGEYYESLTDLNDKLVESWQGNQNTRLKFSEGPYSLENYFSKEETKNKTSCGSVTIIGLDVGCDADYYILWNMCNGKILQCHWDPNGNANKLHNSFYDYLLY